MQTGLPPKVEACEPGTQSMISARLIMTPSGMPEAMPFAMQTMSGCTPVCSMAHHLPVRPDAALDFIHHQQNAVTVADAAQLLHEDGGRDHVSAFALHRLDENGRHFLGRQRRS